MFKHLIAFLCILFLYGCANIQPPSGGLKDTTPPVITESIPENKSLHFSGKRIVLTFSEPVDAMSLKSELIISPSMDIDYEVRARKNKVELVFEKPLPENTTYTLKFGKGIKDITEKNVLPASERLIFSTGDHLDSLMISGSIKNILTNAPMEDVLVGLYEPTDTLDITVDKPVYYTVTNKQGKFTLDYLYPNTYRLYTFDDKNHSITWNNKEELVGFHPEEIVLTHHIDSIRLGLFKDHYSEPRIKKKRSYEDRYEIEFNKGMIYSDTVIPQVHPMMARNGKKLTLFKKRELSDSLHIPLLMTDSVGQELREEIKFIFNPDMRYKKESLINLESPKDKKINPGKDQLVFSISKPVVMNTSAIYIKTDTLEPIPIDSSRSTITIDTLHSELIIQLNHQAKDTLEISINGKFASERLPADSILRHVIFTTKKEEKYGLIEGMINSPDTNFIIQLITKTNKFTEEVRGTNKFRFTYINPGEYVIRVFHDTNNNGKWDNGNIWTNTLPEPVYFYHEIIALKANWEIRDVIIEPKLSTSNNK